MASIDPTQAAMLAGGMPPIPPFRLDLTSKSGDISDLRNMASNFARRGHVFNYRSDGASGGEGVSGSAGGAGGALEQASGSAGGMGGIPWALLIAGVVAIKLLKN